MTNRQDEAVAIVGYGGVFPGAPDPERLWALVEAAVDATGPIPPDRWTLDPNLAYDSRIARPDRVYSTRGGFCAEPELSADGLCLDRRTLDGLDPVFRLALHAAQSAWISARMQGVDRARVGVIFGHIVLPTERSSSFSREILGRPLEAALGVAPAAGNASETDPRNAFPAGLPAAIVARSLGLGGPAFTLDAACASTLYALRLAVDLLREGRVEAMITGGVSRPDPLYTQMGFSQLQALSARGEPAPFDELADGLVVGEGAGLFVLKRLRDAERDGDTIHAVIRGIGLSNDIDGDLLAPSSEGQLRAMRDAYAQSGWSPLDVDLIECHATGTPVGDAVEIESLRALWGEPESGWTTGQCVIGSVKSNVGHLLTAAGAAGLLKLILAIKHQVKPATANQTCNAPRLGLEQSPFRVLKTPEPWAPRDRDRPRRAALSGFGFGGINAHLLLEEWTGGQPSASPPRSPASPPIAIVGMAVHFAGCRDLKTFQRRVLGFAPPVPCQPPGPRWGAGSPGERPPTAGFFLEPFEMQVGRFRIPPRELGEMLPQQSLMLKVAAEAIEDAAFSSEPCPRTGIVIGLGLDQNTNNFELRWWVSAKVREWSDRLNLGFSASELDQWTCDLLDSAGPALTANRTMGSLGGVVASRIAREFRFGGPSFSISCDEGSGIEALRVAADWLRRGELDAAIVGAVDLAGDIRSVLARERMGQSDPPGEGAVALVLKRLGDALRDGDQVYALVPPESLEPREPRNQSDGPSGSIVERTKQVIGNAGAAAGLAALAGAATCLHFHAYPKESTLDPKTSSPLPWLNNREDGPRRIVVDVTNLGGTRHSIELQEAGAVESDFKPRTPAPPPSIASRRSAFFRIEADDEAGLRHRVSELIDHVRGPASATLDELAESWWARRRSDQESRLGMAVIADSREALLGSEEVLLRASQADSPRPIRPVPSTGAVVIPPGPRFEAGTRLAFVYPGIGNVFPGMGRDLALLFPSVVRQQERLSQRLRDQFLPDVFWDPDTPCPFDDHQALILGQISTSGLVTDILRLLGVSPDAAIGYSMGESAALISLGAWTDCDELARRLLASPLFATELSGPCHAARRVWGLGEIEPVDWVAGIVTCPSERVEAVIAGRPRVYVLIRNSAEETVIGGEGKNVRAVVAALGVPFVELPAVSTVHCPVGLAVEPEYRALHDLPTSTPPRIDFYSGVWKRAYRPDRRLAADAITAQATGVIDFPAVVEQAYADGVRIFVEPGPGSSCTRLIDQILADRPHVAVSACVPHRGALGCLLEVLGRLIACRVPVDLNRLYQSDSRSKSTRELSPERAIAGRTITIAQPPPPSLNAEVPPVHPEHPQPKRVEVTTPSRVVPGPRMMTIDTDMAQATETTLLRSVFQAEAARADAHAAFLRASEGLSALIAGNLENQLALIERIGPGVMVRAPDAPTIMGDEPCIPAAPSRNAGPGSLAMDREQCLEFAIGSIAAVLGPEYSPIDDYPTRVRLPDEPLMLVDRILTVEGQPRSLTTGRVVTEHDVRKDAWYLDARRIPPCIAIEAGQADLFLSGFLGIDFETRGVAVYRLLDATVTFHRGLPGPGEVIRYDIRITKFFRQGETHLFRFEFDGTVAGEPLLTMRDGCAGFFSAGELAAGKGIVPRPLDLAGRTGVRPADWRDLTPQAAAVLDENQVDALRRGDLGRAFGEAFDRLDLVDPLPLPGGRMTLVHRVERLDPQGGRFGLGLIRAEADIHPGDWFMVCHFVDDRVMPGTLMYECCLHTLRIFLMRLGWVGSSGQVAFEPLSGVANRLRCRGQVIESTKRVTYEIVIKELGYGPEPYAIADALMFADGKPIVEVSDMALRLTGTNRVELEDLWRRAGDRTTSSTPCPAQYDRRSILAFATGRPSEGFGDRYRPFDQGRFIARLPAPPYSFLDRVTVLAGRPWETAAGASALAEYDIPADAWFFEADRQDQVPYAVLLEAALQSCGWVSAYMGSALRSDEPLKFRNLGGTAIQHQRVSRDSGTLRTSVKATKVTRSAGMIIQEYDFTVRCEAGPVFEGQTSFGFFHPDALERQVGIQEASAFVIPPEQAERARSFGLPDHRPFPDPRWRMIERIDAYVPDGGPQGLGVIEGSTRVDPGAWFFQAHFLGDPVWPGSLGLESFLQLLRVIAVERWGGGEGARFDSPGLGCPHRWLYRGQIVPRNARVTVQATVLEVDEERRELKADGLLAVDDLIIYQMKDFKFRLRSK